MSGQLQIELEAALFDAFPRAPLPSLENIENGSKLVLQGKKLFSGRSWAEVVGCRLNYGKLAASLSIWMEEFPPEVFDYYVASHLLLASLYFEDKHETSYVDGVVEAFTLPPIRELDMVSDAHVLQGQGELIDHRKNRLAFYHRMTPAQRTCIGRFLDLFGKYRSEQRPEESTATIFISNRDWWLHSLR